MNTQEWLALLIVAIVALVFVRSWWRKQRQPGCNSCESNCERPEPGQSSQSVTLAPPPKK